MTAEQYVAAHTGGEGFDIVYDTVGGSTLDDSFASVRTYTGHALSCLGWGTQTCTTIISRCQLLRCVYVITDVDGQRPGSSWRDYA
jgi:NADPH2:quinone reductase